MQFHQCQNLVLLKSYEYVNLINYLTMIWNVDLIIVVRIHDFTSIMLTIIIISQIRFT